MDQVDRFFDEKREKRGRLWDEAKNGMKFEDDVANEKLDSWKLSSSLFPIFLGRRLPVSRVRNIVAIHLLLDSKKRSTYSTELDDKRKRKNKKNHLVETLTLLFQQKLSRLHNCRD